MLSSQSIMKSVLDQNQDAPCSYPCRRQGPMPRHFIIVILFLLVLVARDFRNPFLKDPYFQTTVACILFDDNNTDSSTRFWVRQVRQDRPQRKESETASKIGSNCDPIKSRAADREQRWRQRRRRKKHRRNYTEIPVTEHESAMLDESYFLSNWNLTAAVCHPTLHGQVSLETLHRYVSYYRLLGFDQIFIWYKPDVAEFWNATGQIRGFYHLKELSYVTLTEYREEEAAKVHGDIAKKYYGQHLVQDWCTSNSSFGAAYDWVLVADIDEFLWFRENWSVKDFLRAHDEYTYFSLGKWMYTQHVAAPKSNNDDNSHDAGFELDRFAFTDGPYCYRQSGNPDCPDWVGRCKLMIQPAHHPHIALHGSGGALQRSDAQHLNSLQAHLKEWNTLARNPPITPRVTQPGAVYTVWDNETAGTHFAKESQRLTENGKVLFAWDFDLHDWLAFVASGCGRLYDVL